ncbi:aminotransferase class I/II-fold pyridoxal phosphate-dependent enzyme [Fusobacterium sp.]|uniref:aminotransferase class I/II-fold pyridoxal phosphate-dependent enzyme n=1 Tax=Fusobacterium sp. TaxID=68766 RepID=UPI0028FDFD2C|nr:aminotransferase class I/II-fold pyridoxal phosphate-dependent enzyme [Fusobacterium sp.]MDU1911521.1 aminotransferase class I/II-fold pyridoxal phosphate-dependent enzyme [Fusobacterium sp.]
MDKKILIKELNALKSAYNFRQLKECNNSLINLSSNDYLGLANDEELLSEFYSEYAPKLSSSSSRLIDGSYHEVMELEKELEIIYENSAILFNSGFDANSSIIETFYNKKSLILTDRLNHASIYDGILNSEAVFMRYKHLDMNNLESLLIKYKDVYDDILVVSETIYSMDGDVANLKELVNLKKKYNFDLMIDEAHSYGVYGYGIAKELNVVKDIDFLIIPLGKGGGSIGAYVICSQLIKDYIINKSRKFIYTTALPPVNNMWNFFILKKMPYFKNKMEKLQEIKKYTHNLLKENCIETLSSTHIISIIIGNNSKIIEISENMKKKGFLLYGVKEPTVPKGTARFRIGLNPYLSKEDIFRFVKELKYEINTVF